MTIATASNFQRCDVGLPSVNLAAGTASRGGFTDTLTNMSFVFGSKFADTIVGDAHNDYLDGGGAPTGLHDTITGGAISTFVFQQGYGALTITNFDQVNGIFNAGKGDNIQLNNLGSNPTVDYVTSQDGGSTDTVLGFRQPTTFVALLNVTTRRSSMSINGSEFKIIGGNIGGGPAAGQ